MPRPLDRLYDGDDVEVLDRTFAHDRFFRVSTVRLRHQRFDGDWTGPLDREVFERPEAVALLAYDPDADMVVLVEQFRIGPMFAGHRPWILELVAGMAEPGEAPETVAVRECREETGLEVDQLTRIGGAFPSPGGSSEFVHLYAGRVDSRQAGGLHGCASENEDIKVHVLSADAALAAMVDGRIQDSQSHIALYWLAANRESLRRDWSR